MLYRLPAIAAAKPEDWILLLEGEKDVDRAVAEGWLLATTNPFGAQAPKADGTPGKPKWEPQYTATLRGRNVAVCLDSDPAGGNSQRQIANILRGHVAQLTLITLPRMNPPEKKDLSNWFNDDGSIDTVGDFQGYATLKEARDEIKRSWVMPTTADGRDTLTLLCSGVTAS